MVRFANEVHVIGEHGELDESHPESIRSSDESFAYGRVLAPLPQIPQTVSIRSVTCVGWLGFNAERFECATRARFPSRLRPAPLRAPPHDLNSRIR